jgi:hypothetical protein
VSFTIARLAGIGLDFEVTVDLNAVENAKHSLCDAWVDQVEYYNKGSQDLPLEAYEVPPQPAIPGPHCENNTKDDWGQDRKDYQV